MCQTNSFLSLVFPHRQASLHRGAPGQSRDLPVPHLHPQEVHGGAGGREEAAGDENPAKKNKKFLL